MFSFAHSLNSLPSSQSRREASLGTNLGHLTYREPPVTEKDMVQAEKDQTFSDRWAKWKIFLWKMTKQFVKQGHVIARS